MSETALPMTVIGGYLGAGKTTFINRLLTHNHGKRLFILVNDFGAINIDADLLISKTEDTLQLTNGCVCCTMGADLYMAIGRVLDMAGRPDHIIVEASGIADPLKIATASHAEPDLTYAGIITLIDGLNIDALLDDPQIGAQVTAQLRSADLLVLSKVERLSAALGARLKDLNPASVIPARQCDIIPPVLLKTDLQIDHKQSMTAHPDYTRWAYSGPCKIPHHELADILKSRPAGLFRVKGFVMGPGGEGRCVQVVGQHVSLSPVSHPAQTRLVGIGLKNAVSASACDDWWYARSVRAQSV